MPRFRFVFGTLCVFGLLANAAPSSTASPLGVPHNIIVDARLDDIVDLMAERSPTFREQMTHLGSVARLHVRLIVQIAHAPFGIATCRAESTIRKYQFGRIEAAVRLSSRVNAVELIAHELEHVREYITGANFRRLSSRVGSGVWASANGHYETARAVAVGRRVAQEVEIKRASR